jgi:1,5-anhydro-D-fructose reductase (1,5-anhydro-D-mannitol-forming)
MSSSEASLADVTSPHIRWGIIGCGAVCEVKSGPAFYKCENSSLVAVMCRNVEKARDFAERHNVRTHYGTVEELIQDPQVDCVYVATPPGGDRVSIAKAIVAHKKPCYMEKPLGRDGNEAEEIAKLFREASLPLYCGYYRRYMPKFRNVQECLPKIGLLTSVAVALTMPRHLEEKSHWHYDRSVSGGGILLDMGCHMLDLVVCLSILYSICTLEGIGLALFTNDCASIESCHSTAIFTGPFGRPNRGYPRDLGTDYIGSRLA